MKLVFIYLGVSLFFSVAGAKENHASVKTLASRDCPSPRGTDAAGQIVTIIEGSDCGAALTIAGSCTIRFQHQWNSAVMNSFRKAADEVCSKQFGND